MAVTATVTDFHDLYTRMHGYKVVFDWTSDGSGDASGTTKETIIGLIRTVITNPDGTAVPSADWNVYLRDYTNAADLTQAECIDRSATVSQAINLDSPAAICDRMTCVIADAGDTKKGTVTVIVTGC